MRDSNTFTLKIAGNCFQVMCVEKIPHADGDDRGMMLSESREIYVCLALHSVMLSTLLHEISHAIILTMRNMANEIGENVYEEESICSLMGFHLPAVIAQLLCLPKDTQEAFGINLLANQETRIAFLLAGLPQPKKLQLPQKSAAKKSQVKDRPRSKHKTRRPA